MKTSTSTTAAWLDTLSQAEAELLRQAGIDANWIVKKAIRRLFRSGTSTIPPRSSIEIAGKLGCSTRHLYRAFSESGIRLSVLIRWARLLHAMLLRSQHPEKWNTVSAQLGFETPSAFSHYVKTLTCLTPTEAETLSPQFWLERAVQEPLLSLARQNRAV